MHETKQQQNHEQAYRRAEGRGRRGLGEGRLGRSERKERAWWSRAVGFAWVALIPIACSSSGQSTVSGSGGGQAEGGAAAGAGGVGGAKGGTGGSQFSGGASGWPSGGSAGSAAAAGTGATGGQAGASGAAGSGGTGVCNPGDVRSCGSSNTGICRFGQESCVPPGTWSGQCENNIEPTQETCDGRDEDCDGKTDDDSYLPDAYDSIEWLQAGYFGLGAGVLIAWDDKFAVWNRDSAKVSMAGYLVDLWTLGGTSTGTPPPSQGIDSIMAIPKNTFGVTADTLWVTAGPNLYAFDSLSHDWSSATVQSLIGLHSVVSAVVLFKGDIGLTEDTLFLSTDGKKMYALTASAGLSGPVAASELLCPAGTQGTCPPGADSMARLEDSSGNLSFLVAYKDTSYISPLVTGQPFDWQPIKLSNVSCEH